MLILGLMENAMNLLNISPFAQYVVRGLILLAAVLVDRYNGCARPGSRVRPPDIIQPAALALDLPFEVSCMKISAS